MLKKLSSIKLTIILIICFIVLFITAILMTNIDNISAGFKQMNNMLIIDWILNIKHNNIYITIWFIAFCITAFLFGINLILCTSNQLTKHAIKKKSIKSSILLILHIVFLIILSLHAISLVFGYKTCHLKLSTNEIYKIDNTYSIKIDTINYIDDYNLLSNKTKKKSRLDLTKDVFHYKENYAGISLIKDKQVYAQANIYIFSPLFKDRFQISIENFIIKEDSKDIAVIVNITKNYFQTFFFVFYGLGIVSLFVYLAFRWRSYHNIDDTNNTNFDNQ